MYALKDVKKGFKNPSLVRNKISQKYGRIMNTRSGIDFLAQDWDNLILLDGCRYDLFEEVINQFNMEGILSCVNSNASSSDEYFEKNYEEGRFGDLVYLSANPHIDNIEAYFYDIIRLWNTDWDDETGTVLPADAASRTVEVAPKYKDKRIVLHMMQPHRPFLGKHAEKLNQVGLSRAGVNRPAHERPEVEFWWNRMDSGELTKADLWPAYRESLEVTLPYVKEICESLHGKTIVTADHGNAFGENGITGHPSYTHHETLVKIPWFETQNGPRKDIVEGNATVESKQDHFNESREQLKALGYL